MDSTSNDAMRHVQVLAGEIGCRPIGTPANHRAAEYIAQTFRDAGLSVSYQEFPCPDWRAESTRLRLGDQVLEAYANTFSPGCDLVAPTVTAGSLRELELAEITGRVVIFLGDLSRHELGARHAIYLSDRDRRILDLLEEKQPAAVLTINPTLHHRWRLIEDFDFAFPSATLPARAGLDLIRHPGEPVHLAIVAHRAPSNSANVIARRPGDRPERVVVCAHYDTKVDTPGAYDNATGIAALLALSSRLPQIPWGPGMEWVAFSGEEIYGLGDMTYAARPGAFDGILAVINLDGVGCHLSSNTVATFSSSPSFMALVDSLLDQFPGIVTVDPWPASDHYIFYSNGVPSVALTSTGVEDLFHTPADTLDWISPEKLEEAVSFVHALVLALADKPLSWTRMKST